MKLGEDVYGMKSKIYFSTKDIEKMIYFVELYQNFGDHS